MYITAVITVVTAVMRYFLSAGSKGRFTHSCRNEDGRTDVTVLLIQEHD
jgi:hypothetical protein